MQSSQQKNKITIIVFLGILLAQSALAQNPPAAPTPATPPPVSVVSAPNPLVADSLPKLVNDVVTAILGIVGALTLFMFVYGGVIWMTSAGNSGRIERGKDTLIWATIGLIVIFMSYAILNFIFSALTGTT